MPTAQAAFVAMKYPENGNIAKAPREAFEIVYRRKGWVLVDASATVEELHKAADLLGVDVATLGDNPSKAKLAAAIDPSAPADSTDEPAARGKKEG